MKNGPTIPGKGAMRVVGFFTRDGENALMLVELSPDYKPSFAPNRFATAWTHPSNNRWRLARFFIALDDAAADFAQRLQEAVPQ